jgi:hypothetical protein
MRLDKVVEMIRGKKAQCAAARDSRRCRRSFPSWKCRAGEDEIKLKDQEARADIIIKKDEEQ